MSLYVLVNESTLTDFHSMAFLKIHIFFKFINVILFIIHYTL